MKEIFGYLTFTDDQKKIITDCREKNSYEYQKWFYKNLIIPVSLIVITAGVIFFYRGYSYKELIEALFNGSISLLGINILFSMSSYVIRRKNVSDAQLNKNVVNLSDQLNNYQNPLVIVGAILYLFQVLKLPENGITTFILIFLIIVIFIFSVKVGALLFIIRDDFFMNTYDIEDSISENVSDLKNSTDDLP